jgi:hypothetical protein
MRKLIDMEAAKKAFIILAVLTSALDAIAADPNVPKAGTTLHGARGLLERSRVNARAPGEPAAGGASIARCCAFI